MINKIINGICLALTSKFGDSEVYTEAVKQGLEDGSFIIECLNPTNVRYLGQRYYRTNQFCIHYFPKTDEPKSECNEILEQLYEALEIIEVDDGLVRGTDMSSQMDDNVLHFFVNYNLFMIRKNTDEVSMEEFDHTSKVKG